MGFFSFLSSDIDIGESYSLAKQSAATTATPAVAAGEPVLAKAVPTTAATAATTTTQECKLARSLARPFSTG